MQKAVAAGHPRTFDTVLPSALEHSIAFNAESNPAEVASLRAAWFSEWTNKATELSAEEDKLKSSLPGYARDILLPKRIALWREILRDLDYPDLGVVDEMLGGVVLTGQTPCTNIFPAAFKPAKHTDRELEANAVSEQKRILGAIKSQGHLDILLEEKVDEEVELGWLSDAIAAWEHDHLVRGACRAISVDPAVRAAFAFFKTELVHLKAFARDQIVEHTCGSPAFADQLATSLWESLGAAEFFTSVLDILPHTQGVLVVAYASRNFPTWVEEIERELSAPLLSLVQPGQLTLAFLL
ncbi:hypothetical protein AK812_SmicGene43546 [Symbiodinium microadriaticum]|uniref:Uncharacterized protein n=1 Tax=Symbiodinium microadriaticum TaxID=2951 RepID=A0A1Q9C0Q8_SYMMI|nr:hypothetical protein AK812_SmicGene43546 [Symbiodinium microadriaticum]